MTERLYKNVWNNLSESSTDAYFYVATVTDEAELRRNGAITASFLQQVLEITPESKVLEIGCGVARIGRELAPLCAEWHGVDISGNMIAHAARRTEGIPNIYLRELPESSLSIFPDNYFDCVYSTIVFMHLDKLDMFRYMREAYRVLAPKRRAYFDTFNIRAPEAWQEFLKLLAVYPSDARPAHISQFSTPQEMEKFMTESGFEAITVDDQNLQLVVAVGRKPDQPGFRHSELLPEVAQPRIRTADGKSGDEGNGNNKQPLETAISDKQFATQIDAFNLTADNNTLRAEVTRLRELYESQSQYLQRLEQTIEAKNQHIVRLEQRLNAITPGALTRAITAVTRRKRRK